MRKFTLLLISMFIFSGISIAQVIEDFESLKMNLMAGGSEDLSSFTVVSNPDPTGANTSGQVVEFLRDMDGVRWEGFYATLPTPVDLTNNKYVHVKIWKPRISPVVFKFEWSGGSLEIPSINPQTQTNQWEEMVFDFSELTGEFTKVVFMPDFMYFGVIPSPPGDSVSLDNDITIYFDDFYINNDPTVGSAPAQVMEDYEIITLNYLLGGAEDLSSMQLVPNPDPTGINVSNFVINFNRDKDGVPWGGFWSALPETIDVTTNKFVHVKVWKPRISPIKFKIENGPTNHEIFSKYEQTKINEWEDIVFDYSEFTGTWPIIAFLPDFSDPVNLTEDITIYFDDIILNNDPNPITATAPELTLNVDMSTLAIFDAETPIYLSGALGGIYGTWNEPGTNANNQMFDTDGDTIYSITLQIPFGLVDFKFFYGPTWGGGDPVQMPGLDPGNRNFDFTEPISLTYIWGVPGVLGVPQNSLADKVQIYPNPVNNELMIKSSIDINRVTISSMLGQVVGYYEFNDTGSQTINTSSFKSGLYFVTLTTKDGSQLTQKLMKN